MQLPSTSFLGDSKRINFINGCNLALTSYNHTAEFEEKHTHENPSVSLLLKGAYQEDISGSLFKRQPGDLKFVDGGQSHRCYNYSIDTVKINLEFTPEFFATTKLSSKFIGDIAENYLNKITLIKLYHGFIEEQTPITASSQLLLFQLFNQPVINVTAKAAPQWVDRLRTLLHDEWDGNFDLQYLSAVLGVHPVTISKWFPFYFKMTLSEYLRLIKVEKAISLLKNTKSGLSEIAYACGFADQAHFTRTFKAATSFLPKDFRKI